eukprot:gnl/MRDRNA2_/MRDRNA2_346508_c0_seq1.p1 gnl/MRDRNA2_/MRDRNA2_346508_c0~~gnl/MRDRNA2_/MRDRNA2_346508_c0_seq1.p1  ORF type:complete len:152 (-),score=22.25 gnl/MRDRNA2_/MRDRNA2_346508_c0_seq1:9-410(-)
MATQSRFLLQPAVVAILIALIFNRAAIKGEDAFDKLLHMAPGLTDFSHEHHEALGHVGRAALHKPQAQAAEGFMPTAQALDEATHYTDKGPEPAVVVTLPTKSEKHVSNCSLAPSMFCACSPAQSSVAKPDRI